MNEVIVSINDLCCAPRDNLQTSHRMRGHQAMKRCLNFRLRDTRKVFLVLSSKKFRSRSLQSGYRFVPINFLEKGLYIGFNGKSVLRCKKTDSAVFKKKTYDLSGMK